MVTFRKAREAIDDGVATVKDAAQRTGTFVKGAYVIALVALVVAVIGLVLAAKRA